MSCTLPSCTCACRAPLCCNKSCVCCVFMLQEAGPRRTCECGAVVGAVCPAALGEGAPSGGRLGNGLTCGKEKGRGWAGRLVEVKPESGGVVQEAADGGGRTLYGGTRTSSLTLPVGVAGQRRAQLLRGVGQAQHEGVVVHACRKSSQGSSTYVAADHSRCMCSAALRVRWLAQAGLHEHGGEAGLRRWAAAPTSVRL